VPRLLAAPALPPPARRTIAAFDRQWRAYGGLRRLFGKDPRAMAANLVGPRLSRNIDASWYPGRLVLDAGCGHGRYLAAFASLGARVVGVDAGAALRSPDPGTLPVIQASVLALPFAESTFDLVFCDGVIHHTPDPAAAFAELARVVRPGGALYVWVYPLEAPLREALFGAVRALTTRLPGPAVRTLSFALAPLTLGVRSYSGTRFGRATWAECAQVVHDWLAPPLQSHHDYAEVAGWAGRAGLRPLERLPVPTGITAWKPKAGEAPAVLPAPRPGP
jgi:SAM-dependent methyltransferase